MSLQMPTWDQTALYNLLSSFIPLNDPRAVALLTAPASSRFKLQSYALHLNSVLAGQGVQPAVPTGWRYIASANGTTAAAISGLTGGITSITTGPQVQKAFNAIVAVGQRPEVLEKHYDLVMLSVPGVRVEACWLRFIGLGGADLIWPFYWLNKKLGDKLQAGPLLSVTNFLDAIKDAAGRDRDFYAKFEPMPPALQRVT